MHGVNIRDNWVMFQILSVLLCHFCVSLKLIKIKGGGLERKEELFSLPLASGVIFTTKMLVLVLALQIFLS